MRTRVVGKETSFWSLAVGLGWAVSAVTLLGNLGCASDESAKAGPRVASDAQVVDLFPYRAGLYQVSVVVNDAERAFLFDTGAGVTTISAGLAEELGCEPYGQLTGFRMHGDRVDLPKCTDVSLKVGDTTVRHREVAVLDLVAMLPPDWPKLDGVLSLASFDGNGLTLDLGNGRLILETPSSFRAIVEAESTTEIPARLSRPVGGAALDIFLGVQASPAPLWFEVDTGSTAPVLVNDASAGQLGLSPDTPSGEVTLRLGNRSLAGPYQLDHLIYDGVLGAKALERMALTLDLARGRVYAHDVEAREAAGEGDDALNADAETAEKSKSPPEKPGSSPSPAKAEAQAPGQGVAVAVMPVRGEGLNEGSRAALTQSLREATEAAVAGQDPRVMGADAMEPVLGEMSDCLAGGDCDAATAQKMGAPWVVFAVVEPTVEGLRMKLTYMDAQAERITATRTANGTSVEVLQALMTDEVKALMTP